MPMLKSMDKTTGCKISIITPTYKRLACLKRLSRYILKQTHQNWEWLIIADGHDEKVKKFVESLRDARVQYFSTEPTHTSGMSQRNFGIHLTSGDLVCYVDDDNVIFSTYLEELMKALSDPEIGYAICSIQMHDRRVLEPTYPFSLGHVDTLCFMTRPSLVKKFDAKWALVYEGDYAFISSLSSHTKGAFVKKILGEHRRIGLWFDLYFLLLAIYRKMPAWLKNIYRFFRKLR